jgi:hypothetical protein
MPRSRPNPRELELRTEKNVGAPITYIHKKASASASNTTNATIRMTMPHSIPPEKFTAEFEFGETKSQPYFCSIEIKKPRLTNSSNYRQADF